MNKINNLISQAGTWGGAFATKFVASVKFGDIPEFRRSSVLPAETQPNPRMLYAAEVPMFNRTMTMQRPATARAAADLVARGYVTPDRLPTLEAVARQFSVAVTPAMLDAIDTADAADPIARQFLPDEAELMTDPAELADPIGDAAHSPVKGIVHRYPDRVLLKALHACPVYCRFCFRREVVGPGGEALNVDELQAAISYIRDHGEIWEVILSGGDPLMLSPRRLAEIIQALEAIPHLGVIRLHSRVPVADPARVDQTLIEALQTRRTALYIAIHCNHPRELSPAARDLCLRLTRAGIPLLGQSVLLKGVNDNAAVLTELFRAMVESRIKPYYLHHADLARGTAHFRTSIAKGRDLMRQLRGRISGLCQPAYVLDIPGGFGKVPVGPDYLSADSGSGLRVEDYRGETHAYSDSK